MPVGRFVLVTLLVVAGLVAGVIWGFPVSQDFRPENPFWNGFEGLATRHAFTRLDSLSHLPAAPQNTALVVVPSLKPSTADIERLRAFVHGGGTLVLADDYGSGNVLLQGLGVPQRFAGAPLLDPLLNYRTPRFPLAVEMSPSPLVTGVSRLALNHATALQGPDLTSVAFSSPFSYLDTNGNGRQDPQEPPGPFPVVGHTSVGKGRLILVSDPSIFINTMIEAEDNARLLSNLVASLGPDGRVFLDQSLLPVSNLTLAKGTLANLRGWAAGPAALSGAIAILTIAFLWPIWRWKGATSDSS